MKKAQEEGKREEARKENEAQEMQEKQAGEEQPETWWGTPLSTLQALEAL